MTDTCTVVTSAVTGARCGEPADVTFTSTRGERFAECAAHAPRTSATRVAAAPAPRYCRRPACVDAAMGTTTHLVGTCRTDVVR